MPDYLPRVQPLEFSSCKGTFRGKSYAKYLKSLNISISLTLRSWPIMTAFPPSRMLLPLTRTTRVQIIIIQLYMSPKPTTKLKNLTTKKRSVGGNQSMNLRLFMKWPGQETSIKQVWQVWFWLGVFLVLTLGNMLVQQFPNCGLWPISGVQPNFWWVMCPPRPGHWIVKCWDNLEVTSGLCMPHASLTPS